MNASASPDPKSLMPKTVEPNIDSLSFCPSCHCMTYTSMYGLCGKCRVAKPVQSSKPTDPQDVPMGVSQWRNAGKKWGYWDFFTQEAQEGLRERIIKECVRALKGEKTKWEPAYEPEDKAAVFGITRAIEVLSALDSIHSDEKICE